MKPALLLFAALLLPSGPRLSTDYAAPRTLRIEVETEMELETTRLSMERDGEPLDGAHGFGDQTSHETSHLVVYDTTLAHEDGRPTKIRRRFETVEGDMEMTFGDQSMERERESPFDGLVLVLERDEEGDVTAEVVEGSEPDDPDLLRGHRLELGLDALLPAEELEVGASWEIENEAVRRGLGLAIERALFPPRAPSDEGEGEGGRGRRRGMGGPAGGPSFLEDVEWEATATLVSLGEDLDGEACARIDFEIRAEGELPEPGFGGSRGDRAFGLEPRSFDNGYEIGLEGHVLFALEARVPREAVFEGSVRVSRHTERERNGSTMVIESEREGTWRRTVKITVEARENEE